MGAFLECACYVCVVRFPFFDLALSQDCFFYILRDMECEKSACSATVYGVSRLFLCPCRAPLRHEFVVDPSSPVRELHAR